LSWIAEAWPWLLTMGVLILFSAFFSGCEAALFSLDHRGRKSLVNAGIGGRIALRLLENPERLLSAILFWNLLINVTYFAIAAIIGARLEVDATAGRTVAIVFTVLSLLAIIFFSEMLPKSLAVMSPLRLAVLIGAPLTVAVRLVSPVLPLVTVTNLAASRLIWPSFKPEPEIDLADIERAIELGTDDAALLQRERLVLRGLVEMAETRVSELMRPRSKLWMCSDPAEFSVTDKSMPAAGYLMITDETGEMIAGAIGVRMLRPSQLDDLSSAVEPVIYVPWSALASQVLDRLNEEDRAVAVVVNEFGELVGAVSIDAILRRVLAPADGEDIFGEASVQKIEPDHYRVSGSASVRGLAKRLGIQVSEEGITTVAGFIQRHNERLPRPGDSAVMGHFTLTVIEQQGDATWIDVIAKPDDREGQS
jgi:CBS domain containing-hemolysin-like protein